MLTTFKRLSVALLCGLIALASPAYADPVQVPVVTNTAGRPIAATAVISVDDTGAYSRTSTPPYGRPDEAAGTLTPSTSAYAAGQSIGGVITVDVSAAVGSSMANQWIALTTVLVVGRSDTAPTNQTLAPIIFDENPSASTFTDRTNSSLAAADYAKVVIWTSASASGGSNVVLNALSWRTDYTTRQAVLVQCDADGRIYLALTVGGAITFGANPNLSWRVQFGY